MDHVKYLWDIARIAQTSYNLDTDVRHTVQYNI